jgi:hypothetical protein
MALLKKRRCGVPAGQIKFLDLVVSCPPCFVPGCHAFNFKIAASGIKNALLAMTIFAGFAGK